VSYSQRLEHHDLERAVLEREHELANLDQQYADGTGGQTGAVEPRSFADERDTLDAEVVNIFGSPYSKKFEVPCGPAKAGIKPPRSAQVSKKGLCLEAP